MLNAISRIGLYITLGLILFGITEYIANSIIKNNEIQNNQGIIEDSKAKD